MRVGNGINDATEAIDPIEWTVYGKISKIEKQDGTTIRYTYDVAGNRISKAVTIGENTIATWYSRDAQGNTLAVYEEKSEALSLTEHHLYGSSRLGLWSRNIGMNGAVPDPDLERGNKFFELSNHLGNVLVTVSDRKTGVDSDSDGDIDFYLADVVTATDYAPFGMSLVNRSFKADGSYRYGFNGKERDHDLNNLTCYDYGFRIYNPALGKFLSRDPLSGNYPMLTTYQFSGNNPIVGVDLDGREFYVYTLVAREENGKTRLQITDFRGASDVRLNLRIEASVNIFNSYLGVTSFDLPPINLPINFSDLGISANVIDVNGSLRVLPSGIDWGNLPRLDDPIWETMETTEDFIGRVIEKGNNIIQGIENAYDLINLVALVKERTRNNSGRGEGLGVKESNLDPPRERAKRLKQLSKGRPKHKKGLADEVWEKAKQKSGGKVYDPKTGKEIVWDKSKKRKGQWDLGHIPDQEYRKLKKRYESGEINWEQFKKEYNNPDNYRPELPSSNRSNNQRK